MHYFFHVYLAGVLIEDPEGSEFTSEAGAQAESYLIAAELAREFPGYASADAVVEVWQGGARVFATRIYLTMPEPQI